MLIASVACYTVHSCFCNSSQITDTLCFVLHRRPQRWPKRRSNKSRRTLRRVSRSSRRYAHARRVCRRTRCSQPQAHRRVLVVRVCGADLCGVGDSAARSAVGVSERSVCEAVAGREGRVAQEFERQTRHQTHRRRHQSRHRMTPHHHTTPPLHCCPALRLRLAAPMALLTPAHRNSAILSHRTPLTPLLVCVWWCDAVGVGGCV